MTKLTAERLRSLLRYDPDTGLFHCLVRRVGSQAKVGDVVGSVGVGGYIVIRMDNAYYYGHRLARLYMTGEWPPRHVDHINMCRADNRWSNLRDATPSQNHANTRASRSGTSGFKGVSACRDKWQAHIRIDGRKAHLGTFATREEAHAAYAAAAPLVYGEFARAA